MSNWNKCSSAALLGLALGATACSRVPSPVTPAFHGSVGLPFQGVLTNASVLPSRGAGYVWLDAAGRHWGTPVLVEAIRAAARDVAERQPGGEPLVVGDLSAKSGGKLDNHASHRTGRDADLLFYISDLEGQSLRASSWVRFGADGLGFAARPQRSGYVQFDLARNWQLVKSLLTLPEVPVMWLFVSRPMEALLTEYALAKGEDPVLVWHAETVMLQPKNALPHDDHFHLRIGCTPQMALAGCEDGGPQWPWWPAQPELAWPKTDEQVSQYLDVETYPLE